MVERGVALGPNFRTQKRLLSGSRMVHFNGSRAVVEVVAVAGVIHVVRQDSFYVCVIIRLTSYIFCGLTGFKNMVQRLDGIVAVSGCLWWHKVAPIKGTA